MLRLLGQSEYGLYQLVYSVVSYLGLLSFGFTASYMRFYFRAKATNDEDEVSRFNGMFLLIFLVLGVICLICGSVMVKDIEHIFGNGLTDSEYDMARVLMSLMVINLALTFPNSVFDAMTAAHEQFFFQKLLVCLQNILNPFLTLPLLLLGYGSIGMVCVTTFLTVAKLAANIWFCFKKLHVHFLFTGLQFSLLKEMWIFTFFIFMNQIIDQINWSVDKFLLGRIAGTTAVAIYGLGAQINTMYLQFSSSISNFFVPKVNQIVSTSNDNKELTHLFTRIGRIQFIVLSLIVTGFIFFGKVFIRFWGDNEYADSYYIALWLIIPVTIPLIQNLGIEIQRAKNMHQARAIVYTFIAIGNIFVSLQLIKTFGPIGAAMGTALSLLIGNGLFMNWYYDKRIGLDIGYFWKNILICIPGLVIPCIVGVLIQKFAPMNNILLMGAFMMFYVVIYSISMYYFGMNDSEKSMVQSTVNQILRKKTLKKS